MEKSTYRVDRHTLAGDWPLLALMLVTIGVTIWAFPRLPDQSAVHWGTDGTADGSASPRFLALYWPILATGIYLLLLYLPLLDPKRSNYVAFGRVYGIIRQAVPALLLLLHLAQLANALGASVSPLTVIFLATTALFFGFGLAMGQIRPNYFIGIRTPWTLESEEVWTKTHQFAGRLWVVLSLLQALLVLLMPAHLGFWTWLAVVLVMVAVPAVYSYRAYRQVSG